MADLTPYQRDILIRTALGEARGEGVEGMADVIQTIFNRARSGEYPSDPAAVALQDRQYSTWNKGEGGNNPQQFEPTDPIYQQAAQALEMVMSGSRPDFTGGALNYHTPAINPYWADSVNQYGTIERNGHVFYPTHPMPPGEIPNAVASALDVRAPRRIEPSLPTPMDPSIALARQMNSGGRTAPDSSFYAGMFPAPPMPPPRAPITDRDLISSSGISDTVRNSQAQQDTALAAALQSRIATTQRSGGPPLPSGVAQSYAGQERASATAIPPVRPKPPMPTGVNQSYAAQEAAPTRPVPPKPPAAPTVRTAEVPAGMPTNMRSRDSVAQAADGRTAVANLQAPSIPGPRAPVKSEERLAAGIYPKPPMPTPDVATAPAMNIVPDMAVASLLDTRPPMPQMPVAGFPTSAALRPRPASPLIAPPPMPTRRAATGFPTPATQRPTSRQPLNVTVNGAGSYGSGSGGSSSSPRYVMAATGKEVRPVETQIYNPDTNKFEARTVYR